MKNLHVALFQFDIRWQDKEANINLIDNRIKGLQQDVDVLLLPETFSTGFVMQPTPVAETMQGDVVQWMSGTAKRLSAHVLGSVIMNEEGHYYNRLVCAHPDGALSYYNKRHLFTFAGEGREFSPGEHMLEFDVAGWKIRPLVCYDLRFPVWSRNATDYDILLYVANWPRARIAHWTALLKARAIENQCYCIGLNRIGRDGNQIEYNGQSEVFNMNGDRLINPSDDEMVEIVELSYTTLQEYRSRYNFLADRDRFTID